MSTRVILPRKAFKQVMITAADLGGGCRGCALPPPEMTCGFLIQLVFCKKKKLCGLLVLKQSKRRVHPPLKKILDLPLAKIIIHTRVHSVDQPPSQPGSQSVSLEVWGGGVAGTEQKTETSNSYVISVVRSTLCESEIVLCGWLIERGIFII